MRSGMQSHHYILHGAHFTEHLQILKGAADPVAGNEMWIVTRKLGTVLEHAALRQRSKPCDSIAQVVFPDPFGQLGRKPSV